MEQITPGLDVNFQTLFNVAVPIVFAAVGWILNTIWQAIRDMQKADEKLTEKVAAIEILVAGSYVTRSDHDASMIRIEASLRRIEDKLDGKADK